MKGHTRQCVLSNIYPKLNHIMKILYYFYELDTPMYLWQREHFMNELSHYGIEFITFNPAKYDTPEIANEEFIRFAKTCRDDIDLFLSCDETKILFPETVREIKRTLSVPTVLICWDNLELPYKQEGVAKAFDLIWLTSHETEYLFKSWGCKTIFQTYAANPYFFHPNRTEVKSIINKVGFIGTPYGSRANKLNYLISNGVECAVYSNSIINKGYNHSVGGTKKFDPIDIAVKFIRYLRFPIGRKVLYSTIKNKLSRQSSLTDDSPFLTKASSVSHDDMCSLYSSLSLSLNISELRDTYILKNPIPKIHLRTFEIPMCGGLQITSYNDEIAGYFEDNKEIILYHSDEELFDKAKFYLDERNTTLVAKMKSAARLRAENEHTWKKRFDEVMKQI